MPGERSLDRAVRPGDDGCRGAPHVRLGRVGWELSGTHPAGAAQYVILAVAACAMGIQSAAVNQMGLGNVSTTFLTGTLTGLVSAIARPEGKRAGLRRPGVLVGLVVGAVLAGVLLANAPAVVPLLPLAAVAAVALLGAGKIRLGWLEPDGRLSKSSG